MKRNLRKSGHLSAFKYVLLLAINLFYPNPILAIISVIYALINLGRKAIFFICLLFLASVSNICQSDYLPYGVVDETSGTYILVDKILYKEKVFTGEVYEVGEIVKTSGGVRTDEESLLKYNCLFISYEDPVLIYAKTPRYFVFRKLSSYPTETGAYLKRIILNTYDNENDLTFIGYGFSFYYLLLMIKRKNRKLCLAVLGLYVLLFRFDLKFYLIVADLLSEGFELNRVNKLSFRLLVILIINKYLLFNKSIWISLVFIYLFNSGFRDKPNVLLFENLCFNELNILFVFFYRYYLLIKIFLFILSLTVFVFLSMGNFYLKTIGLSGKLINALSFGLRGRLSLLSLFAYFIGVRLLKVKNQYLRITMLSLLLILPTNNFLQHVDFIDIGQGNATLIHGPWNTYNILVDTGSKYNYTKLKNELYKEGIYYLDYLFISHSDEDHSGNLENLKKDFRIGEVITEGRDIEEGDTKLKYLPLGEYDNENDNSLVYLLEMDGRKILLPGDVSKKVENIIVNKYGIVDIDILDIGHHGSNTSSSAYFIGNLNPEFVVISTNGKYGHPHKETIETLESFKLEYLITKNEGSIRFYLGPFDFCLSDKRLEVF